MECLCESFSTGTLQDLSSAEEYENLSYSQNVNLNTLRNGKWLKNSIIRYKRYLEYTSISSSNERDLEVIRHLIFDFLSFDNWDMNIVSEITTQAAKCITIDMLIIHYIHNSDTDSDADSVESF